MAHGIARSGKNVLAFLAKPSGNQSRTISPGSAYLGPGISIDPGGLLNDPGGLNAASRSHVEPRRFNVAFGALYSTLGNS